MSKLHQDPFPKYENFKHKISFSSLNKLLRSCIDCWQHLRHPTVAEQTGSMPTHFHHNFWLAVSGPNFQLACWALVAHIKSLSVTHETNKQMGGASHWTQTAQNTILKHSWNCWKAHCILLPFAFLSKSNSWFLWSKLEIWTEGLTVLIGLI